MKGLTVGAMVLCKVLISEPGVNGEIKTTEVPMEITSQPRIKEGETVYTIIEGEIQDIQKQEYYVPVKDSGKFEKKYQEDLVIKGKEIDYLVISSRACGLKKDLTEMTGISKSSSKPKNQIKEEILVIRGDSIPEGYEQVKDKVVEDKVKESYSQNINEQELLRQEEFLKNLENDQARFSKKKEKSKDAGVENVAKDLGLISPDQIESDLKEIEKFEESERPITAEEAFKEIEEKNVARLEKERKEQMEQQIKEQKENSKKIAPQKATTVVPAAKAPVIKNNEKSILKDALKIITNE